MVYCPIVLGKRIGGAVCPAGNPVGSAENQEAGNGGADVFTRDAEVAQGAVVEGVQFAGGATFGCIHSRWW